jgi:P27 family predicted phage terminase small subunit
MRGRKPKSSAQRQLEGNPGKRPFNKDEPQPPPLPDALYETPPPELAGNPVAQAEWLYQAPKLRRARQISAADRSALIALCLEWARYLTAQAKVAEKGLVIAAPSGYPMPNPYLAIATRALQQCIKLWPELGLTPSSRSRVTTVPDGDEDQFAEFDQPPASIQ